MNSTWPEAEEVKEEVSAGIITFRRKASGYRDYLLLKHKNGGHWSFPKGHIEEGEIPKKAALRELEEETALVLQRFVSEFNRETCYTFKRDGRKVFKTVIYFLGVVSRESQVELSSEHLDYCWLPYEDARQRLTYEGDKELLDKAEQKLNQSGSIK
ncbi:NUDIX domain-containing protein [Candidatus Bipolaricaulota bacterium]|nr:NUDIX domain-containing protein [Candidatus Bipolaricaulota bacterium]